MGVPDRFGLSFVIVLTAVILQASGAESTLGATDVLERKLDTVYRRDTLSEVLVDLDRRAGLRSAYAKALEDSFLFTLEMPQVTVCQILEKLSAAGGLELEFDRGEVFLWKKCDDGVLAGLDKKLKSGDVETRCKALTALAQLSDKRIYPLLFNALNDADPTVVERAVVELHENHVPAYSHGQNARDAVDTMLKLLASEKAIGFRLELIDLLGRAGVPSVVDPLIALANDVRQDERIAFSNLYMQGASGDVRGHAINALGQTRDPRAVEALSALSKDTKFDTRLQAANALSYTRDKAAVERLIALLKDKDNADNAGVIVALSQPWDSSAIETLVPLLKDPEERVRTGVIYALGQTRDPRALEALIPLLKDAKDSIDVANAVGQPSEMSCQTYALRPPWDPHALEHCITLLKDEDAGVREAATMALYHTRDPRAVDVLIAQLKDPDSDTRRRAANALCHTRDPRLLEPMIALLKDVDVRESAANCLSQMRDPRAEDALLALLKDADEGARDSAWGALSRIHDPRAEAAVAEYEKARAEKEKAAEPPPVKPPAPPPSVGDF